MQSLPTTSGKRRALKSHELDAKPIDLCRRKTFSGLRVGTQVSDEMPCRYERGGTATCGRVESATRPS